MSAEYKMTTPENYTMLAEANTRLANASRAESKEDRRKEAFAAVACAGEIFKASTAGSYAARTAVSIVEEAQLLIWR